MMWQYSPFLIPLLITTVVLGILTVIAVSHRKAPGAWPVALFLAAATLWTGAYT